MICLGKSVTIICKIHKMRHLKQFFYNIFCKIL